ncbi:max-like protein X isoform X2 [Clavelina lepadiformis]|uniref:max-like protein X isoform X2 n=1 Tax=Clavelina lepadiformis TaxID=159417 RepID=UPI0040412648
MAGSSYIDSSFDQLNESSCALDIDISSSSNMMQISNPSSAASSVPNTDEEDDEGQDKVQTYKERRREAHTQAEKKRRDAIRKGYDNLQGLVPNLTAQNDGVSSQKLSKAVVLQRTLSYVEYLQQQKKKQAEEVNKLRKEKVALTIMKTGSFSSTVSPEDFEKLSLGAINWIEEECKPQTLRYAANEVLRGMTQPRNNIIG